MKKLLLGIAAALSMTACNENKQQQQTAAANCRYRYSKCGK